MSKKRKSAPSLQLRLRIADLRRLASVVAARKLHESEEDADLVVDALIELAAIFEGKPKKPGRPSESYYPDTLFLQLTNLFWNAQTPEWRAAKSLAFARTQVAKITGWKVPRRSDEYTDFATWNAAALEAMSADELAQCKAFMLSIVPEQRREALAAVLGVRKK